MGRVVQGGKRSAGLRRRISAFAVAMLVPVFIVCARFAGAAEASFRSTSKMIGTANSELYGGGYHNIAVDGKDVYVAYGCQGSTGEKLVCLGASHDGGLTWSNSTIARGQITPRSISIAVGRSPARKIIHVAWNAGNILHYANSSDEWNPVNVSGPAGYSGYGQSMVVDRSGVVHIAFHGSSKLYYTKSNGTYAKFDNPTTITDTNGGEPGIWVDSHGNVSAAWINGCSGGIYFSKRSGDKWQRPVKVTDMMACNGISMVARDTNDIFIGWSYQEGVYVIRSADGGATWPKSPNTVTTPGGGRAASLMLALDGSLHIAWGTDNGVYYSKSTNDGLTWANPAYVMKTEGFPHMALDAEGNVYLVDYVWTSGSLGNVYFAKGQAK